MKVFVTGATGLIGFAVVQELIAKGHQVTGLARSEASARRLTAAGASFLRGDIEDLEVLSQGAASADGVVHTAFYHQVSHIPLGTRLKVFLGGAPTNIVKRFTAAAVDADRRALETMGAALKGTDRVLVGSFPTMDMHSGVVATEDQPSDPDSPGGQRGANEDVLRRLADRGLRTGIVRLSPIVHGPEDRNGLLPALIKNARKKKTSAYVADGSNRWSAVHKLDAAALFRRVLENGQAGSAYHAVAEELPFKQVAEAIAGGTGVPTVSVPTQQAAKQFGFLGAFVSADNPVSSERTQQALDWKPEQQGFVPDLQRSAYFEQREG